MISTLKNWPLSLKLVFIFCLFSFNCVLAYYLEKMIFGPLFGIVDYDAFAQGIPKTPVEIKAFMFDQTVASFFSFLLTAIIFGKLELDSARKRLEINLSAPFKMFLMAVLAIIVSEFFIQYLVDLNGKIPLPQSMEQWRTKGKEIEDTLNAALAIHNFRQFVPATLVFALVPAVAEEFFFRGLLLGALLRSKINPMLSIVISGLIFSLSHFEFDNTIAISVLGIFLGYLYYISGSIWVSVAAHFTFNFLQVIASYMVGSGLINQELANASTPIYLAVPSSLLFLGCIYFLNKWKQPVNYEEEIEPEPPQEDWTGNIR